MAFITRETICLLYEVSQKKMRKVLKDTRVCSSRLFIPQILRVDPKQARASFRAAKRDDEAIC